LIAGLLACLKERRWKDAGATLAGFVAALAPWMLYRMHAGGEEYYTTFTFLVEKNGGFLLKNVSAICATMLTETLPGLLLPYMALKPPLLSLLVGALASALVLLGALAALRRPLAQQSILGPSYLLVSVGLILIWMIKFVTTASFASSRLLLPIAPFALLAFMRGVQEVLARFELSESDRLKRLGAALALAAFAFSGFNDVQTTINDDTLANREIEAVIFPDTYRFIRDELPPDAHLLSVMGPGVYANTGRKCYTLDFSFTDKQVLQVLDQGQIDYLIGLPCHLETPTWLVARYGEMFDASVVVTNDLVTKHPGLLKPVYFNGGGRIGIFKVDHAILAQAVAALKKD
jgi:hypothetical protein